MKIKPQDQDHFTPVTFTLESKAEANALVTALTHTAMDSSNEVAQMMDAMAMQIAEGTGL